MQSREPFKVMHICAPAEVGGLERVVELLALGMTSAAVQVHVLAVIPPWERVPRWIENLELAGVAVHVVRVRGRQVIRETRMVDRIVRDVRPDVMHTHGYRSDLLHGRRGRRVAAVCATTLHGSSRMGGMSHLFEWIQGWALRRFDVVVAVSEPLFAELRGRGVPEGRIALIPNGWSPPRQALGAAEARELLGLQRDSPLVGWVGRLIPIKGCDVLLDALARIPTVPWTAVVVGGGPQADELRETARALGLAERIHFAGPLEDAARVFSAFDLLVISSRSEGTPMVLLEAMGAGVPVVATDVGGIPVALGPEAGRWLVAPEDPDSLADAIRALLEQLSEASGAVRAAVEAGRERAHGRFGLDPWVGAHLEAYRRARDGQSLLRRL